MKPFRAKVLNCRIKKCADCRIEKRCCGWICRQCMEKRDKVSRYHRDAKYRLKEILRNRVNRAKEKEFDEGFERWKKVQEMMR